ncbi:hypothetical protein BJX61DRAFT_544909 [Aspergillus egyptiacus]|nr:hypothetical protein BJX61DRAFT_544909 [Aspergillus egyptiacus]
MKYTAVASLGMLGCALALPAPQFPGLPFPIPGFGGELPTPSATPTATPTGTPTGTPSSTPSGPPTGLPTPPFPFPFPFPPGFPGVGPHHDEKRQLPDLEELFPSGIPNLEEIFPTGLPSGLPTDLPWTDLFPGLGDSPVPTSTESFPIGFPTPTPTPTPSGTPSGTPSATPSATPSGLPFLA